jgi:hypothetical protein
MEDRWNKFVGEGLQARLLEKATEAGLEYRVDERGRCWFDDRKWCEAGDPHIATLDEAFGAEWVSVPTRGDDEHGQRKRYLAERGVRFVEWDRDDGTSLVLRRDQCPADWEHE